MAYSAYVTYLEYKEEHSDIPDDVLGVKLKEASRNIDLLTFNMIVAIGFSNLTEYQSEIVKECVCELADFYYNNEDMVENVLKSYSVNGVSMNFGDTWNVHTQNGIVVSNATFSKLMSTGLCNRTLR